MTEKFLSRWATRYEVVGRDGGTVRLEREDGSRYLVSPETLDWMQALPGQKPYPGATGTFVDRYEQRVWSVLRIDRGYEVVYLRWDYDGEDPGASWTDKDGTYTPKRKVPKE